MGNRLSKIIFKEDLATIAGIIILLFILVTSIMAAPIPKLTDDKIVHSKYPILITPVHGDGNPPGNISLIELDYHGVRYVYLHQSYGFVKVTEIPLDK